MSFGISLNSSFDCTRHRAKIHVRSCSICVWIMTQEGSVLSADWWSGGDCDEGLQSGRRFRILIACSASGLIVIGPSFMAQKCCASGG